MIVRSSTKGQIQFAESIMVVVVLVFLIMVGLIFYYNVSKASVEEEVRYREDIEGIKLARGILSLPELRCTFVAGQGEGCIDELKIRSLPIVRDEPVSKAYYDELFGYATIQVHILTGPSAGDVVRIYDDTPTSEHESQRSFYFTTLYNPQERMQELAYVNVTRHIIAEVPSG